MVINAKSISKLKRLKSQLHSKFKMKGLGAAKKIFDMKILRDRKVGKLKLCQKGIW